MNARTVQTPIAKQMEHLFVTRPERLTFVLGLLLWGLVIYVLALLTLLWLESQSGGADELVNAPLPPAQVQRRSGPELNMQAVVQMHLFGDATKKPEPQAKEIVAPETRLNLKLRGIYASDDEKRASAIIEGNNRQQDIYFIDDPLPGGNNVFLRQVHPDRVILERNGAFETLKFEDLTASVYSTSDEPERFEPDELDMEGMEDMSDRDLSYEPEPERVIDKRRDSRLTAQLADLREKATREGVGALQDLFVGEPVIEDGQVAGIRVSPGRDRRLFTRIGLRRNDVITSVNGQALSAGDMANLFSQIQNSGELALTVRRGTQEVSLMLDLNENP